MILGGDLGDRHDYGSPMWVRSQAGIDSRQLARRLLAAIASMN